MQYTVNSYEVSAPVAP